MSRAWFVLFAAALAIALLEGGSAGASPRADEPGEAEGEPSIRVRARSEIDGAPDILLGDIAEFRGLPEGAASELRAIRLGDSPKRGESRAFSDVGLAQLFRSRLSRFEESSGEKIALLIPSKVVVVAKPLAIGAREIEVELERKIKALCGACEVELASVALPAAAASLPTGATWQVKMRPELPRGPFSLPLEIKNGDGTRRLWWVSGVATLRKKAPVARRALAAGERIGEFDWAMELRDITYLADAAPDASEMASAWASRAIAPGEVIGRSAFRREAAVKLGETVRVVAGSGAWQVSAEGIAQQGGFVGETIRVRIPRTQKTVSGLLRDKGVVEVQ